jgi:hypothetical protein
MPERIHELIVFPTELALRRYQQTQALEHGFVDASGHTTFARLRKLCLPYARIKGQPLNHAEERLELRRAAEIASGHFEGQVALGGLSSRALVEVLDSLLSELALLPSESQRITKWLLDQPRGGKLYQLGTLVSIWRARMKQDGYADRLDINLAILRLLRGNRQNWPPQLRNCRKITFRAVRWLNPFDESCVAALNHKLQVRVESALPPAHAEAAADRLGQRIHSEIMAAPWAAWAEDLGDALAVDSPEVLGMVDSCRINFSRSAGTYGEVEDLARRICWNLQNQEMAPNRIALVVPDIGAVQDIIPHVFSRFQIPYYFRRGRPVLSSPSVKAFFVWLAFPLRLERDSLIDLLRNPAIRIEGREEALEALRKSPPRVELKTVPHFKGMETCSGSRALEILSERIVEPEDHFNGEALKAVEATLKGMGGESLPLHDLLDLLEELLENVTIRPRDSHEQGVWILNPHDAVGLDFDLVLFAGLNEGVFPSVPQQDALLNDKERYWLRLHLEEEGRCLPRMALPEAGVLFEQQSVLFLTALGMAREQLVFSYQSADQEGNEKGAGEYYRKLWNLAGWGVVDEIRPGPYDQWRIRQLDANNIFSNHLTLQQATLAEDREPMPGESFLPIIPLPLCRAEDEALQSATNGGTGDCFSGRNHIPSMDDTEVVPPIHHLVAMLNIEAERDAFVDTPVPAREPSKYCGHIGALQSKVQAWFEQREALSPTALEALAQCRYVFLLEKVFGLDEQRAADDTPDPMERGTLVHDILKKIYTAIAQGESGIDAPRCWAVKTATGWRRRTEGGVDAIPLAVFVPELGDEYEAFAREVASKRLRRAGLGHPGVWAAEHEKILEQILNFVRYDVENCAAEGRFPALFELKFGDETAVDLDTVKLTGTIDRIDLVFSETGELARVRVLDYKGSSRARPKQEAYIEEIRRNLDCQLPVYAFAAQQHFFGVFNTPETNAMTDAGYLFYQRMLKDVGGTLKKSLVPMNAEGMIEGFLDTLVENLSRLKIGDFAVDPLVESYNDYQSVCRVDAVAREGID